jgi:hypothetical protein
LIPILAQVTEYAPRADVGGFLENCFWGMAFFLAFAGSMAVVKVWLWPKGDKLPQPLVITPQASYADKHATEARFLAVEEKIEGARKENKTEMDKMRNEANEGRRRLHNDIDEVPQKVIRLLRDTKGLLDK